MAMLRINDFLPADSGWRWIENREIIRAWVDLRPEDTAGDRNILRVQDANGHVTTLLRFPENTVLVKGEKPR
jgi:hypothetical protein